MKAAPVLLLAGAAACFALVMADQLSSGDLYRPGSSLRTDRDGASVWFEALAKTGLRVERNYAPIDSLEPGNAGLVFAALPTVELDEKKSVEDFERLARSGARVTLLLEGSIFLPVKVKVWNLEIDPDKKRDEDEEERNHFVVSPAWRVVRARLNQPVVVERQFGKGVIAIAAAATPFFNESLRDMRDTALLNWAVGDKRTVIFDESHLGSTQSGTIVGLLRRLRLQGVAAALIGAALLFVWRSSWPWPPVHETAMPPGASAGDALRNLLERRIPPSNLIAACVQEWSRDFSRRIGQQTAQEVSSIAQETLPDPDRWTRIHAILHPKRTI